METVITLLAAFAFGAAARKKGRVGLKWGAGLAMVLFSGSAAIGFYTQAARLSGAPIDPMTSWYWLFIICVAATIALYNVSDIHPSMGTPTISRIAGEQNDTKPCPFCAEAIKAAAIVCKHCKRDLPKN